MHIFLDANGNDIRCYRCNSYTNRTCSDPMDPHTITAVCPTGYVCTKVSYLTGTFSSTMSQKTNILFLGGIKVTSRSCDPGSGSNTCTQIENTLKTYYVDLTSFRCNTCNKNLCNVASQKTVSVIFPLSLLILVLTFV